MNKLLSLAIIFFSYTNVHAQTFAHGDVTGKPYMLMTYENIRGHAFLYEDWKRANVSSLNGNVRLNMMVKFDVYVNKFFYTHGDTTYEFVTRVDEVKLFPLPGDTMIFKNGFSVPGKISSNKFVQVLAEGKVTLIKFISKALQETSEYNVPGKVKVFTENTTYHFITDDNDPVSQKPNQKLLQDLLKDKWATVEVYIKQNSLNLKKEEDCIKAIRYYNSL